MELVPATSPGNKSQGLVASCELVTLPQNLVAGTTNSNWLEFVGLVAGTKVGPCD